MTDPVRLNLTLYQGATFRKRLLWCSYARPVALRGGRLVDLSTGQPPAVALRTPIDLSGCGARLQIRSKVDAADPLLELSTDNGGITLGGALGTIDLYASDAQTAALAATGGVWDLEVLHPGGDVTRLAHGVATISREVTRA